IGRSMAEDTVDEGGMLQIDSDDSPMQQLQAEVDAAMEEADQLRKRNAALQETADLAKSRVEELLEEIDYLKQAHKDMEEERKMEITGLQTQLAAEQKSRSDEKRDTELARLQSRVVELESDLMKVKATADKELPDFEDREREMSELRAEVALLEEEADMVKQAAKSLDEKRRVEIAEMKEQLTKMSIQLDAASKEIVNTEKAGQSASLEQVAREAELRKELEEEREANRKLNDEKNAEAEEHKRKLSKMRKERREMEKDMERLDERRMMLEEQLDDWTTDLNCGGRMIKLEDEEPRLVIDEQQKVDELVSEVDRLTADNQQMNEARLADYIALANRLEEVFNECEMIKEINRRLQEKNEKGAEKVKEAECRARKAEDDRVAALVNAMGTKTKKNQDAAVKWAELERSNAEAKERNKMLEDSLNASFARFDDCNNQKTNALTELTVYQMKCAVLEREQVELNKKSEELIQDLLRSTQRLEEKEKELELVRQKMRTNKERSEEEEKTLSLGKKRRRMMEAVTSSSQNRSIASQTEVLMMNNKSEGLKKENADLRKRVMMLEAESSRALVAVGNGADDDFSREALLAENARLRMMIDWYTGTWSPKEEHVVKQSPSSLSVPSQLPRAASSAPVRTRFLQRTTICHDAPQPVRPPPSHAPSAPALGRAPPTPGRVMQMARIPRLPAPPMRPALEAPPSQGRSMLSSGNMNRGKTPLPPPPPAAPKLNWKDPAPKRLY
ncbi:hypothetical protein PFISCL1PPCAC_6654, partial [Pristionchus fissidentatus]